MYKELVRRNVVVLAICLVIFVLLSVYITNQVNHNNTAKQLVYLSDVVAGRLKNTQTEQDVTDVVNDFTQNQTWLEVVYAGSHGRLDPDGEGIYQEVFDKNELKIAASGETDDVYVKNGRMCNIRKITDDLFVRTSVEMQDSVDLILYSLFIMAAVLILTLMLSVVLNRRTSGKVVDAFNNVSAHLRLVGSDKYTELDTTHKYEEVAEAYREINSVNRNIINYVDAVKAESEKANFIINNMLEGLIIVRADGTVYCANKQACVWFDVRENCTDKRFEQVIGNEFVRQKIVESVQDKTNCDFDLEITDEPTVLQVKITWFKGDPSQEKSELMFLVAYDVTAERSEERNKAEFIANASHELKTPITAISGFAELLLSGLVADSSKQNEYVRNIYNASISMRSTVEEMLYLSKIDEASFASVTSESVDLAKLIRTVSSDLFDKANLKNVSVCCFGENVFTTGKTALIKHLVTNLVDNAIKYNKDNGSVTVSVTHNDDGAVLTVSDTGYGIEKQNLERVFDRFFRMDNKRYYEVEGVGLGLAIAKKICDLHRATISVVSQPGKGTTFTVQFFDKYFRKPTVGADKSK